MKEIKLDELKEIQLKILDYVHNFCEHNELNYSLAYGTLIGAIRHKGYIPWDDDIDILLLREDYEKFINSFSDSSGRYKLHCIENDSKYLLPYAKIEDTYTIIEETGKNEILGINIDVFPVDNLDDSFENSKKIQKKGNRYGFLNRAKFLKPSPKNNFIKKLGIILGGFLLSPISARFFAYKAISYAKKSGKPNSKYLAIIVCRAYAKNQMAERSWFDTFIEVPFEGKTYKCMYGYDSYLRSIYGDYMQLPPEDKRHSPHTINNIYWK